MKRLSYVAGALAAFLWSCCSAATYDFTGLATSGNWSPATDFTQDTTTFTVFKLAAQTANGSLSALRSATTGTTQSRAMLTGKTWASTMAGKITLNGVAGQLVTDDTSYVFIVVESGGNQWKGYYVQILNGFQHISRVDSNTTYPGTGLGSGTSDAVAEGDTFELSLNKSTGVLILKHNGTQIDTATDTTYSSGLTTGFLLSDGNHAGTGISQLVTTGESSGSTIVPIVVSEMLH